MYLKFYLMIAGVYQRALVKLTEELDSSDNCLLHLITGPRRILLRLCEGCCLSVKLLDSVL